MLNKKIEFFEKLAGGIAPIDILNYYKVLELYPTEIVLWD